MWAKIITIKRTKDLNYFSLCAFNLFNTRVSQFELNYWNKWTFPQYSNSPVYFIYLIRSLKWFHLSPRGGAHRCEVEWCCFGFQWLDWAHVTIKPILCTGYTCILFFLIVELWAYCRTSPHYFCFRQTLIETKSNKHLLIFVSCQ